MKIILPSLAWFALMAGWGFAQTQPQPPVSPTLSIRPADPAASSAGAAVGVDATTFGAEASVDRAASSNATGVPPDAVPSLPVSGAVPSNPVAGLPVTATQPGASASNSPEQSNGVDLFMQSMTGVAQEQASVEARIRYHADLFGQQTVGAGLYLQQGVGNERQFRLELKTAVGQQLLTFQQVCDGKYLWQYQEGFDKPKAGTADRTTIARVDLRKVREALDNADPNFQGASSMTSVAGQLAWGGLPKLLTGLQNSFRFTRVEAGKLDTLPVWIAAGSWRPEAIATISKELANEAAGEQPFNLKLLPPQLPEQVLLYVGQDDLFPYRIEYRRRPNSKGRGGDADRADMLPIVTVEFYEARLNTPINPREFDYQPGSADVLDTTAAFIKSLQGKK